MSRSVLSLGQCALDHSQISQTLRSAFGVETDAVASADAALHLLRAKPYALVLVNRIFDADGSEGLSFIERLKTDQELAHVPVMLVSNYPEAQAEAVRLGALAGFGKSSLAQAREKLATLLGS